MAGRRCALGRGVCTWWRRARAHLRTDSESASRRIFLIFGHEGTILVIPVLFWYPVQCHALELMISSLMETTVWGAPLER